MTEKLSRMDCRARFWTTRCEEGNVLFGNNPEEVDDMKALLLNGSSHSQGTTMAALQEMVGVFTSEGVECEIIQCGAKAVADCLQCGACARLGRCVIEDDGVNMFVKKARDADAFVFASPVYYAHPSGRILSFLDRAFFSDKGYEAFRFKPAASVVVARRGGCSATFDALNKYFGIAQMPVVSATYWNSVHGSVASDAPKDEEGMQTVRNLARNMVWMMRCLDAGRKAGIALHETERGAVTNFVR